MILEPADLWTVMVILEPADLCNVMVILEPADLWTVMVILDPADLCTVMVISAPQQSISALKHQRLGMSKLYLFTHSMMYSSTVPCMCCILHLVRYLVDNLNSAL